MIFCIFSDVEGMGNIWFLLAFISKNCSLMSCYLIYYYRYDLRKWSDRYEYIRRWRSALYFVVVNYLQSINQSIVNALKCTLSVFLHYIVFCFLYSLLLHWGLMDTSIVVVYCMCFSLMMYYSKFLLLSGEVVGFNLKL